MVLDHLIKAELTLRFNSAKNNIYKYLHFFNHKMCTKEKYMSVCGSKHYDNPFHFFRNMF